ncbi:MAG: internal scaffolding protein [Microvirus sp.]|nr:MAG: internal scaffolding protein [Microvirus sp.]
MKPKLKSSYDDHSQASDDTGLECKDKSLTKQADEAEANINNIVARFRPGEEPRHQLPPLKASFQDLPDMQTAMNMIVAAREAFMTHPAAIRARFNNDPAQFVDFCSDEANRDEMRKMGLYSPEAQRNWENQAQLAKEAAEANARDAAEHRASKQKGDNKQKGVT